MRRAALVLLALLVLVAVAALRWRGAPGPPPAPITETADAALTAPTDGSATGDGSDPAPLTGRSNVDRSEVDRSASARGPTVQCQLTGLLALAPWTGPIAFELRALDANGRSVQLYRERAQPAADGTFTLQLPVWADRCTLLETEFLGSDPLYRPLTEREQAATLASSRLAVAPLLLPVVPVVQIRGRVTDPAGQPLVGVRVQPFAMADGAPVLPALTAAVTDRNGGYTLRLEQSGSVWLIATPRHGTRLGGAAFRTGSQADGCSLFTAWGTCNEARTLVLRESLLLRGRVRSPAGEAVPSAVVHLDLGADVLLDHGVGWWRDGSCAGPSRSTTDDQGEFELQLHPTRRGRLVVEPPPTHGQLLPLELPVPDTAFVELQLLPRPARPATSR